MPEENYAYQQSMEPWPNLSPLKRRIQIPPGDVGLFFFESGTDNQQHLIMVHGLGDEADTWRHIIEPLSENYHIIAPDLPGFGRSDQPDVDYTPKYLMDSLLGLMNQLNIKNAILMGNSLGAILSQGLAISHPKRIKGLILIGGSLLQLKPIQDLSLKLMQIPLVGEWLYNRLRRDPDAAFDSLRRVYYNINQLPEDERDFLYTRVNKRVWHDKQRRAYFSTLRNLTPWIREIQAELPEKLADLHMPILVIRGAYDKLFSDQNAKSVQQVMPNATLHTIDNSGHLPHQEAPALFLNITSRWLDQNFS